MIIITHRLNTESYVCLNNINNGQLLVNFRDVGDGYFVK